MKVNSTTLYRFHNYRNQSYHVNSVEEQELTLHKPVPMRTGYIYWNGRTEFPEYLKGFEHCYQQVGSYHVLKDEFKANRPEYTITVKQTLYDVTFTEEAKLTMATRYVQHQRLCKIYSDLLNRVND